MNLDKVYAMSTIFIIANDIGLSSIRHVVSYTVRYNLDPTGHPPLCLYDALFMFVASFSMKRNQSLFIKTSVQRRLLALRETSASTIPSQEITSRYVQFQHVGILPAVVYKSSAGSSLPLVSKPLMLLLFRALCWSIKLTMFEVQSQWEEQR